MRAYATILCVCVLLGAVAHATQFRAFDRAAQVAGSDAVLVGRVKALRSGWDEAGTGIYTDADVAVEEVWKGMPDSDHVIVRVLGGSVGGVALAVEGTARFAPGERVVLFLIRSGEVYRPWGMIYGKYEVRRSRGGDFVVGSLPPAVSGAQSFPFVSLALDELRLEVRGLVEGGAR